MSDEVFTNALDRPHVLVVMPQAVGSSWVKTIGKIQEWEPFAHQYSIAAWLSGRQHGLIAADMGTGKTLAALMSSGVWGRSMGPCDITRGAGKKRAETLKNALLAAPAAKSLVVLVNYESVWRGDLGKLIAATQWQSIILDEAHRIKAPNGKASRWLARLAEAQPEAKRICLTGTPMPQSPLDIFGPFRFMDPRILGKSFPRFRAHHADMDRMFPSKVIRFKNQDELAQKVNEHSWRVEADEVLDLPGVLHETIDVNLSPEERRIHSAIKAELTARIGDGTVTVGNALTRLLRLQQATSGYVKLDDDAAKPIDDFPTKRRVLEDRLGDLASTEPVVVFCKFRSDLDEVAAAARTLGREYAEVSGARKDLERWQAGDAVILGVQMQSGGVGIDCSRAAFAFYYSLGFSLGDYEQSLARLRRPGQTRMVRYYHLVAPGTVDEQVYAALRDRKHVIESVMTQLTKRTEVQA